MGHIFRSLFFVLTVVMRIVFAINSQKCLNRPRDFTINGQNYFFSDNHPETQGKEVGWAEARKICQEYCMDTISVETQKEFDVMKRILEDFAVAYIWTSGHVCDAPECLSDPRFLPVNINGWYWTHNSVGIPATNRKPPGWSFNPWSQTGLNRNPQPDNAEFNINGKREACLAVLHNVYDDGIMFHDVACYHKKKFICEDSPELLSRVLGK